MVEPLSTRFEKLKDKQISEYTPEETKTLLEILSNQLLSLSSIPQQIEKLQDEFDGFRQNAPVRYILRQQYDTKIMEMEHTIIDLQKAITTLKELQTNSDSPPPS